MARCCRRPRAPSLHDRGRRGDRHRQRRLSQRPIRRRLRHQAAAGATARGPPSAPCSAGGRAGGGETRRPGGACASRGGELPRHGRLRRLLRRDRAGPDRCLLARTQAHRMPQPPVHQAVLRRRATRNHRNARAGAAPSRSLAQPSRQVLAVSARSAISATAIKPTGIFDAETRSIEQFQRSHNCRSPAAQRPGQREARQRGRPASIDDSPVVTAWRQPTLRRPAPGGDQRCA